MLKRVAPPQYMMTAGLDNTQESCQLSGMFVAAKRIRAVEDRLQTAIDRVEALENERRQHVIELDEMFEKISRLYRRISKREQRANPVEDEAEPSDPPCADPVTQKVLAFREAKAHVLS